MVEEKDACLDPVAVATCAIGSPLSWAYAVPVVDGPQPFSGGFPPNAPTAALNAAEAYAAATGFPLGAHQNNLGSVSYAMFGAAQLGQANCGTIAACPAGIVVVNDVGAITYGYPDVVEAEIAGLALCLTQPMPTRGRLWHLKRERLTQSTTCGLRLSTCRISLLARLVLFGGGAAKRFKAASLPKINLEECNEPNL